MATTTTKRPASTRPAPTPRAKKGAAAAPKANGPGIADYFPASTSKGTDEPEVRASRERERVQQYKDAIIREAQRWHLEIIDKKSDLDSARMAHASAFKQLQKDPKHHPKAFKHARMLASMTTTQFTEFERMLAIYKEAFNLDKIQVLSLEDVASSKEHLIAEVEEAQREPLV